MGPAARPGTVKNTNTQMHSKEQFTTILSQILIEFYISNELLTKL